MFVVQNLETWHSANNGRIDFRYILFNRGWPGIFAREILYDSDQKEANGSLLSGLKNPFAKKIFF